MKFKWSRYINKETNHTVHNKENCADDKELLNKGKFQGIERIQVLFIHVYQKSRMRATFAQFIEL